MPVKSYVPAVSYILIVLVLAHFATLDEYVWYLNSISQLAAQGYSRAWIMEAGFIGFGVLIQIGGTGRMQIYRPQWYREIPIMLYGLGILLSGIFSTSPFVVGVQYSETEAQWHTVFATLAGVALSIGILLFALTDSPSSRRMVHWITLVLILLLSFLFGNLPMVAGALQRALWLVGFSWLVYLGWNRQERTKPAKNN